MTSRRVYLDYNATTPIKDEVKAAIIEDLNVFGNASSMHTEGRLAHERVELARQAVGNLIGAPRESIVFTSGGSESNNTVFRTMQSLVSNAGGPAGNRTEIITTAIEHPCVMNAASYLKSLGFSVHFLSVDEFGKINMGELGARLSEKTLMVSVMLANNEIGTVQDIPEISRMVKAAGAWMHTDAVQAAGKIPVNVDDLQVDYLTLSAHKIYGPKGTGALYIRKGAPLYPLIHGGHQENGLRAGTYNNTGILGFGKAAELALRDLAGYGQKTAFLKKMLLEGLLERIPKIKINPAQEIHPDKVLPNTLNVSFPGAEGEAILLSMDLAGIEASTGSACASGSLDPSHVLMAIGLEPELAHGSIRFSLGLGVSEDDIKYTLETLPPIIGRLRSMSSLQI